MAEGQFDALVNFAAESHVDRSISDATPFLRTNVLGTQCLLDAARAAKVPRYVQVSTDEVYGTLEPDDPAFSETTPLAPNSPYAASKAGADLLVRAAHHTFGLNTVITRCSNNYGPYQFPEKLIPLFITNVMADIPVPVYGDGRQVRDWIYVLDHCRGIDAALRRGRAGEVYNFGGKSERYNIDVTRAILKLCGKPESLIRYVTDRWVTTAATPSTATRPNPSWAGTQPLRSRMAWPPPSPGTRPTPTGSTDVRSGAYRTAR